MYDAKSEAHEFVAAGRQEAIEKACQFFQVEAEELAISEYPAGEVYGLASRAVIVAIPKNRKRAEPRRGGDAPRREEGSRSEARREGRERGRGRQGGNNREERRPEDERGPRRERTREASPRPQPSSEPSVGTATGELGEIGEFVLGVIERMDLGPFEIGESREDDLVALEVKGPAARALAAGEGRTVDALQLLANQVSARSGPEERLRVVVDIEGNADAREEFLAKLAQRVAKRALDTGRAIALDPMNGKDRRVIHVALRDRDDVATMSEGEGRYRQVVVVPEGAEGFEEAREQSERIGNS